MDVVLALDVLKILDVKLIKQSPVEKNVSHVAAMSLDQFFLQEDLVFIVVNMSLH